MRARVAEVSYVVSPGHPAGGEDRVFATEDAVIVLDGATQPGACEIDGGWLAETLGRELQNRLPRHPGQSLRQLLADSIAAVRDQHGLQRGSAPSTTVAVVRWNSERVDALVLGDTPVVVLDTDGAVHQVRDDRLVHIAAPEREELHQASSDAERQQARRTLVKAELRARNRPGGYWIAEADPLAARHAVAAQWPTDRLTDVLVVTDGVSIGVDLYGSPPSWLDAIELAREDPALLVRTVDVTEESDPGRLRWPRSKRHDDKAAAVVRFLR